MLRNSAARHLILGLRQQPVHRRNRTDACRCVVERRPVSADRATEQEEIGDRLQVILDPMIRLLRQRPLEFTRAEAACAQPPRGGSFA